MENDLIKKLTDTRVSIIKTSNEIAKVEATISEAIAKHQNKLAKLRQQDSELQAAIKEGMEKTGTKKFENEVLTITYIAPSTRSSIDVTRLRDERPELVEEYLQITPVNSSIRIKVKE